MTNHCKVYFEYFDIGETEIVLCEACQAPAVDIHHIHGRGKGKDVIENLIACCRKCHNRFGSMNKEEVQLIHNYFIQGTRKRFLK